MQSLYSPAEIAQRLAARVKELRLARAWSQKEVALRSGIPVNTYRFFERTGQVSLLRFIRLLDVFGAADEFDNLGKSGLSATASIDELMKPTRRRGRTAKK